MASSAELPLVQRLNMYYVVFWGVLHAVALYTLVCCCIGHELITGHTFKKETYMWSVLLHIWTMVCVNCGVHRLWSHHSYEAAVPLRLFFMLGMCAQNSDIYIWAKSHRVHHKYSDTKADPHDATRGVFFCHFGWLICKPDPAVTKARAEVDDSDLKADWVVMLQHNHAKRMCYSMCFIFPALVAMYWGETFLNGFLVAGILRFIFGAHCVFLINSVGHSCGDRPYTTDSLATENPILAVMMFGEWHNWHHAFMWDYANAEMGSLRQYNPSKMFIDLMALFGQAWGRKRAHRVWEAKKRTWEKQKGRKIEERIIGYPPFCRREVVFGPEYEWEEDAQTSPVLLGTSAEQLKAA